MRAAALLLALAAPAGAAGPRLVSLNPCVDAVLAAVADPDQIAGVSHYSQDSAATSVDVRWARRFPATGDTAEDAAALAPAIVLAGAPVPPATVAALARLHLPLHQFPVPASIGESMGQVRAIAALAGHPARGLALAAAMAQAVAHPPAGPPVPALIWGTDGLVPGAGTLLDEILRRTGYRNLSAAFGLKQWDVLPLEYLVARPPAVLFATPGNDRLANHPALAGLRRFTRIVPFPARFLFCGGPTVIAVAQALRAARPTR